MTPSKILDIAPRKIRIGGFDWTIEWGDTPLRWETDGRLVECWGLCLKEKHTIQITTFDRPSGRHVISTLIHELLHAIHHDRRIPADADEETMVVNLEHGLMDVLIGNPGLLDFIKKGIK